MSGLGNYPIENGKLQVGNGYNLELDQLARLLSAVCGDQRGKIPQPDLASAVGVAERKVENLASLANALGLIQKVTYKPTVIGILVQRYDPYFDDIGTLWFLHYSISSDPRFIIWNRIINVFLPRQLRFTRDQVRSSLADLREWFSEDTIKKHVLKEINTFLDAYTEQAFSRLAFIRKDGEGYALGYRQPVPSLVLAACIARYRANQRPGDTAIPIPELCCSPCSPGLVLQIPEERFRVLLEELKNQPGFTLESRADLDQVGLSTGIDDIEWMRRYYESR
jgi:hypothetical protein